MIKLLCAYLVAVVTLFSAQVYGQNYLANALHIQTKMVFTPPVTVPPGTVGQGIASCPASTVLTGGGYFVNIPVQTNIVASFPASTNPLKL